MRTANLANPTGTEPGGGDRLVGYQALVCVCGGISAYKSATLVSALVQRGVAVSVAMTHSARRFVGRATFEALTGRPVGTSLWRGAGNIDHLKLSETADVVMVAPATANVIGKLAGGIADDLVSTLLLGAACPVMMAPAMNANMWAHASVQRNVATLRDQGVQIVGPGEGWQACRAVGPGRMSEPEELLEAIQAQLLKNPPRERV